MRISVSTIKRFGRYLPFVMLVAASSLPAAPAAAAGDPLPDPNAACSSLTLANLQAVIDGFNSVINGPATQDINSVPSSSVWPGANPSLAQNEHDYLVSGRDTLVKLRDTLWVPSLVSGNPLMINANVDKAIQDYSHSAINSLQWAEYYAIQSAAVNRTFASRDSYLAMEQQLMPAVSKLGADGGACDISQYRPAF